MFAPRLTLHDPRDADHILMPHDHDHNPLSSHQHSTARYTYTNSPLPSALRPQPHISSSSPSATTSLSVPSQAKRRHVCGTCDRSFTTSGHLARHARVHTGERNHKCPFPGCETRCSRQDNLQQHYRIHLSPGSRRNSGPATRAAMTEALSSSDRSTSRRRDSQRRGGTSMASSPPSPSLSPIEPPALGQARQKQDALLCERSATPEAPDTPPPLAPALPRCYRPVDSTGSTSSRSSTSSTPEGVYHSSHGYSNMQRQVETHPASDVHSQRSPELLYPSSEITYASPMSASGQGHAAWGYGSEVIPQNHHEIQERLCHSGAGSKASTPPSPAESVGSHHSSHASDVPNEAYSYPAPLELQYPDSSPVVQSHLTADRADVQYVHSTSVLPQQPHMHFRSARSIQVSRHSIAHISPPRPQASPLSPDMITSFPSHPLTPVYSLVTTMTTSRLHDTGSTSASPHTSPTTERRFTDDMSIEVPQSHQLVYQEYSDSHPHASVHAHGRTISGPIQSEYPGSVTAPHFGRGYLHSQSLPSHHGTHGTSVRTRNSSPLTLAPIDDVRGDRNGEDLDVRQSAHSQSHGTSRPYSHQSHHHGPAQVYPELQSHVPSAFTECAHSEGDRSHNLTVHQPRPQRAIPGHQQYLNYYDSSFSVAADVGWSAQDVGGRGQPAQ